MKTKTVRPCSVFNCKSTKHHAKGYCLAHYLRMHRFGSVFAFTPVVAGQKRVLERSRAVASALQRRA